MHMAWVRYVAGRLKSDYLYSAKLVYNNYPWPNTVRHEMRCVAVTVVCVECNARCGDRVAESRVPNEHWFTEVGLDDRAA